jgi:hypothetical protein
MQNPEFMKRNLTVAAVLLIAALCQARDVRSPNGTYAIRAGNSISLVDLESGSTLLVLDQHASGESRVEVAWAPNSMKVAIVEDEALGSVVLGAWTDERTIPADMASDPEFLKDPSDVVGRPATWHKTIQEDNEKAIFSEAQRRFGGLVVAESRAFAGWVGNDAVRVNGEIRLSNGKHCAYQYVAQFNPNVVGQFSKGGFKQGVLVGRNHHFL